MSSSVSEVVMTRRYPGLTVCQNPGTDGSTTGFSR
jgi:hypothetical protein